MEGIPHAMQGAGSSSKVPEARPLWKGENPAQELWEKGLREDKHAAQKRKRQQVDTFESLAPKMRRLQLKLAEGALIHRRLGGKFGGEFLLAKDGVAGC